MRNTLRGLFSQAESQPRHNLAIIKEVEESKIPSTGLHIHLPPLQLPRPLLHSTRTHSLEGLGNDPTRLDVIAIENALPRAL